MILCLPRQLFTHLISTIQTNSLLYYLDSDLAVYILFLRDSHRQTKQKLSSLGQTSKWLLVLQLFGKDQTEFVIHRWFEPGYWLASKFVYGYYFCWSSERE